MFGLWASGLEYQFSGFRAWVVGSRFRAYCSDCSFGFKVWVIWVTRCMKDVRVIDFGVSWGY